MRYSKKPEPTWEQDTCYLAFDNGVRGFARTTDCGTVAAGEIDVICERGRIACKEAPRLWTRISENGGCDYRTMLSMSLTLPMWTARDTSAPRRMLSSSSRVLPSATLM